MVTSGGDGESRHRIERCRLDHDRLEASHEGRAATARIDQETPIRRGARTSREARLAEREKLWRDNPKSVIGMR